MIHFQCDYLLIIFVINFGFQREKKSRQSHKSAMLALLQVKLPTSKLNLYLKKKKKKEKKK